MSVGSYKETRKKSSLCKKKTRHKLVKNFKGFRKILILGQNYNFCWYCQLSSQRYQVPTNNDKKNKIFAHKKTFFCKRLNCEHKKKLPQTILNFNEKQKFAMFGQTFQIKNLLLVGRINTEKFRKFVLFLIPRFF